jgi:uridylate kinase
MLLAKDNRTPIVLSVGGSLIVPSSEINVSFLRQLDSLVRGFVARGYRFFLIAGGGWTARAYRDAGYAVKKTMSPHDLDWLGIHASRLNGHLLRTIFEDIAHPRMIENYLHHLQNWTQSVVIGAGWKPGWSTDYCAAYLAKEYGARMVINLSNISYVYDSDPKKSPNARPLKTISWRKMQELVGTTWTPGMNAPFDPIACKLAREAGLRVVIANGEDMVNVSRIIEGEPYEGTLISGDD